MKLFFSTDFREKKSLNTKFYGNPSSGSQIVRGGQTAMTTLIVAFRNFANAPQNVTETTMKVWLKAN
jgi:hypothetical protein